MGLIASGLFDCVGCAEYVPPSGLGEVVAGLVITAIFLAPGALLHRFLRSRGR